MRSPRPLAPVRAAAAGALALLAAACAATPKPAVVAAPPPPAGPPKPLPAPVTPARDRLRHALELLYTGERDAARAEVTAALTTEPDSVLGKSLLRQIDGDPRELFGAQSFPHRIAPGETLASLAERYLGDGTLSYGLARYNGLDKPSAVEVGRVIQIPGTPPRPKPVKRAPEAARPAAPAAPAAAPPTLRNPARAAQLRAQALPLMAKGEVGRAAALLREALRADPGNALVQHDLARAERIGARVR